MGHHWSSGPIVLGCGSFGGIGGARDLIGRGLDEDASMAALDEAASLGIIMLDTAERYADGASERMMGRWLSEREPSVTGGMKITTKVAPGDIAGRDVAFDSAFIEPIFAGSLERLGVDRVDWLLVHAPDPATPVAVTLEALEAIRETGRCDHIGVCKVGFEELHEALNAAERLGVTGYELVQNGYSLLRPDHGADVRALCAERGLAFTAFSPLARGVLTGKYRRGEPPADGTRLALRPEGFDELLRPAVHDAIDRLAEVGAVHGVSAGAIALAWLTAREDVTAAVTGPSRTAPHLRLAAEAHRVELDEDSHGALTDAFRAASQTDE